MVDRLTVPEKESKSVRLPNLVIAGVAKGGTTSLYEYLAQHPAICTWQGKGINYFSPLRYGDRPLPPLSEYARHFSHCGDRPYAMEASLSYCYGGERVIDAIKRTIPDARIILSLREPVDRLWSSYKMKKSLHQLPASWRFEDYVAECERLRRSGDDVAEENSVYRSLATGLYSEYVGLWANAFGDCLRVVFFEDIAAGPQEVIEGLCSWLKVDPAPIGHFDYAVRNRTVDHRSAILRRLANEAHSRTWRFFRARPRLTSALRDAYRSVNSRTIEEELQPEMRSHLKGFYRSSNDELAQELSRRGYERLPAWLNA